MAYQPQPQPHPHPTHGALRRDLSQHRQESSHGFHATSDNTHTWKSHRSIFGAPELPIPRTMPNNMMHHPHRGSASVRSSNTDAYFSSNKDLSFDAHTRRSSFRDDADPSRAAAPSDYPSRTRTTQHADEGMTHYAPSPPSASVYARSQESNSFRTLNEPYERDHDAYPLAQRRSFGGHDRVRVESSSNQSFASSSRTSPRDASSSPTLPPYHAPQFAYSQGHAPYRRHSHEYPHTGRTSLPSLTSALADGGHSRFDSPPAGWQASRDQMSAKRRHDDTDSQLPAVLLRPVSSSGPTSRYTHRSPLFTTAPRPHTANHDPHLQERREPVRPLPTAGSTSSPHAHTHVAVGTAGRVTQSGQALLAAQHPLQPHRKRLRISRACDECRRRKTRCDIVGAFPGEPGHPLTISGAVPPLEPNTEPKGEMLILQPCMNCRRSDVPCCYTKSPLKRGPSKGYIKDLERRLNSLESQIGNGDRGDANTDESATESGPAQATGSAQPAKPKVRTEDRISRLENVLSRPSTAKGDEGKSAGISCSTSPVETTAVKTEADNDVELLFAAAAHNTTDSESVMSISAFSSAPISSATSASSVSPREVAVSLPPPSELKPIAFKGKGKAKWDANSSCRASDADIADVKSSVIASSLHATFPVVSARSERETSQDGINGSNIARLEDRLLARGLKLLAEPVEMATAHHGSQAPSPQAHTCRAASLIGQASVGLGGGLRDELALQALRGPDGLKALRKVNQRLAGQEADLLMLCHLDHFRNGRSNNAALAAAVAKLGSGSQEDGETFRRRTLLFMLDRWHTVGFGTPHLLSGMERHSFRSMKDALGDVSQSPLGDAVYEVLRGAIMLGDLNDMAQNHGGWRSIHNADVDAIISSVMDDDDRPSASEASSSRIASASSDLLSTAALRSTLPSLLRCYHALHTLPSSHDVTISDLHHTFTSAESLLFPGPAKTSLSLHTKLLQSAIGPHALSIAAVALSWCLRTIRTLTASSAPPQLEFYRRKIHDYASMCKSLCLFSGGQLTDDASFAPVYLRLALYCNSMVSFAEQMGQPNDKAVLGQEADDLLEMTTEIGALGYVLASTTQSDAFRLLTC